MSSVNDIRSHFLGYFERNGHTLVASGPAGAAQRPDADVHQCRHGPVQGLFHRPGAAALPARHDVAEMRARRRQAQRPRQCRLHRAASHLLRDARQFLLRRLFQGAGDRARLEPDHQGVRPGQGPADRHGLSTRTTTPSTSGTRSPACRTSASSGSRPATISGRWATPAPAARARRSSTTTATDISGRPAGQSRRRRRPLHRDLEPRLHAVRAARQGRAHRPAAAVDRHRHGAGAHRRGAAGRPRQLRHRPLPGADRGLGRGDRRAGRRAAPRQPPGHRRPSARFELPDRRRRAAVERGPRLCPAPHHAPRHAPRAPPRRARAADVAARAGAGRARWGGPIRSSSAPRR